MLARFLWCCADVRSPSIDMTSHCTELDDTRALSVTFVSPAVSAKRPGKARRRKSAARRLTLKRMMSKEWY
jgi:hypothetical protein